MSEAAPQPHSLETEEVERQPVGKANPFIAIAAASMMAACASGERPGSTYSSQTEKVAAELEQQFGSGERAEIVRHLVKVHHHDPDALESMDSFRLKILATEALGAEMVDSGRLVNSGLTTVGKALQVLKKMEGIIDYDQVRSPEERTDFLRAAEMVRSILIDSNTIRENAEYNWKLTERTYSAAGMNDILDTFKPEITRVFKDSEEVSIDLHHALSKLIESLQNGDAEGVRGAMSSVEGIDI